MSKLLVIDDDYEWAQLIARPLENAGHKVQIELDPVMGLQVLLSRRADLVLLDLHMPGLSGELVLAMRSAASCSIPVIVLSADTDEAIRVRCLDAGAAVVLAKPVPLLELVAQVGRCLAGERESFRPAAQRPWVTLGAAEVDLHGGQIRRSGHITDLSRREVGLLEHLIGHRGEVCSRTDLLLMVWGYNFDTASNVVDVYVARLRHKLGEDAIETMRGIGYRLVS